MATKTKVPVQVLARAKAVASGRKPAPPEPVKAKKQLLPREKVIRALQKLHPMD